MPSAPLFRATEVTRPGKAMRKAGLEVQRVDIMPDGRISILPTAPTESDGMGNPGIRPLPIWGAGREAPLRPSLHRPQDRRGLTPNGTPRYGEGGCRGR